MKLWAWVLMWFGVAGVLFWLIVITDGSAVPVALFAITSTVSALGTFWMICVAIREEKQPWPIFWLAFLPFSSFWYYFECVRPRRRRSLSRISE